MKENKTSDVRKFILLNVAFSFMICIFGPLSVFFANITEFWFGIKEVIQVSLVAFVLLVVILNAITMLICFMKFDKFFYFVLLTITIIFYIQGNFVPRNYGVFDGKDIDWDSYKGYALASIIIIVVVTICVCCVTRLLKEKIYVYGGYFCIFLIAVQVVTIGTLCFQNKDRLDPQKNEVVTNNNLLNVSDKTNIIIFLLDAFDSEYMENILNGEQAEKYSALFKDFTYYPNTLGGYPTTKGALPHILTGVRYKNEVPYEEYVSNAYASTDIYDLLKKKDYSIGVYTDGLFLNSDYMYCSNVYSGRVLIKNRLVFWKHINNLVLFNYLPHQLKRFFVVGTNVFEQFKQVKEDIDLYSEETTEFYRILSSGEIKASFSSPVFRFYHLRGAHPELDDGRPYYLWDSNLQQEEGKKYEVYDQIYGNFTAIEEYFEQLKKIGVYDNSTIIILADHGQIEKSQNPIFMIKNAEDIGNSLEISYEPMSYDYLQKIIKIIASGDKIDDKKIRQMFNEDGNVRTYLYYLWDDSWQKEYLPNMTELYISGNNLAQDWNNLLPTGNKYEAGRCISSYTEYELGSAINLGSKENIDKYCFWGVPTPEGWGSWTDGQVVLFGFDLSEYSDENLIFRLHCIPYNPPQEVKIYANGNLFYSGVVSEDTLIETSISHEYLDKLLTIRLNLPNAVSPYSLGESLNIRELGLALYEMTIDVDQSEDNNRLYHLGDALSFSAEKNEGSIYCIRGLSVPESGGTWTEGNDVDFEFDIEESGKDLELTIGYGTYGEQRVILSVNGYQLEDYLFNGWEEKKVLIPANINNGHLSLTINLPDAKKPSDVEGSQDERMISIHMSSLVIK